MGGAVAISVRRVGEGSTAEIRIQSSEVRGQRSEESRMKHLQLITLQELS
jgi:hypothetical protein